MTQENNPNIYEIEFSTKEYPDTQLVLGVEVERLMTSSTGELDLAMSVVYARIDFMELSALLPSWMYESFEETHGTLIMERLWALSETLIAA